MKAAGGLVLVAWGAALALIALFGVLVFGLDALPAGLLAGAGAGCALWGLVGGAIAGRARRREEARAAGLVGAGAGDRPGVEDGRVQIVAADGPGESGATVGVALGLTLILTGFVGAGDVFAAIGGAVLALAVAALRDERRG